MTGTMTISTTTFGEQNSTTTTAKTLVSDLDDEWLRIKVFANGHRRFAEEKRREDEQYGRVMARMITQA